MGKSVRSDDDREEGRYGWGEDVQHGPFLSFDGNYGRDGVICVTDTVCAGCNKAAMCLYADQSEGEYKPATICRDCIARLFVHAQRKSED